MSMHKQRINDEEGTNLDDAILKLTNPTIGWEPFASWPKSLLFVKMTLHKIKSPQPKKK